MSHPLDLPLASLAAALRTRQVRSVELLDEALRRHERREPRLGAYKLLDVEGARVAAERADAEFDAAAQGKTTPDGASRPAPFCGIPVSVKDLYGMDGLPTFAGTPRPLPERWTRDGWLVRRLRAQGAVFVGKTHTVEMAYAGVGMNPHWGTPRNPWDDATHRIPGGSSSGAGVSLREGSALVALGTDTGGSIRIPASMTGTVGHKTTKGRWPTDGVVPLSSTLDTVGALTRSVADSVYFFGSIDPAWGDPAAFRSKLESRRASHAGSGTDARVRMAVPDCEIWRTCQPDIARTLGRALDALADADGWVARPVDGAFLDRAADLYLTGVIAGAEGRAFVEAELPGWWSLLHPIVGGRMAGAPDLGSDVYAAAQAHRLEMSAEASGRFDDLDVLVLPGHVLTPPAVADLDDTDRYRSVNASTLRPTCPVSLLGMCALTLPVGFDLAGMPVGLQLVAPGGQDERLLAIALEAERVVARTSLLYM